MIIPLAMIFLTAGGFLIGWAKPVPVNISNLRHPKRDDVLVTLAGPGMNVLLALLLIVLARVGMQLDADQMKILCLKMAHLSLLLCFFNLIPVPPLDGSRVMRVLTGMSWETFARFAQWGFVILIILLQLQPVRFALAIVTDTAFILMARPLGLI